MSNKFFVPLKRFVKYEDVRAILFIIVTCVIVGAAGYGIYRVRDTLIAPLKANPITKAFLDYEAHCGSPAPRDCTITMEDKLREGLPFMVAIYGLLFVGKYIAPRCGLSETFFSSANHEENNE